MTLVSLETKSKAYRWAFLAKLSGRSPWGIGPWRHFRDLSAQSCRPTSVICYGISDTKSANLICSFETAERLNMLCSRMLLLLLVYYLCLCRWTRKLRLQKIVSTGFPEWTVVNLGQSLQRIIMQYDHLQIILSVPCIHSSTSCDVTEK